MNYYYFFFKLFLFFFFFSCSTDELFSFFFLISNYSESIEKVLNKLIITLKLACESRQAKTMSTALDCLQVCS